MSMKNRFLSALMAFLMLFGTLAALSSFPVFAAEEGETEGGTTEEEPVDYYTAIYESKEAKLATMTETPARFGFQLYYDSVSGEVAVRNVATGDVLFTNPYDVGGATATDAVKDELLSQIIIDYSGNGKSGTFTSYAEAAKRGQIKVKNIKNGIRVEYIMGKQESRMLLPEQINKDRFEQLILANVTDERKHGDLLAFYKLKDPNDPDITRSEREEILRAYPVTKDFPIYVFDGSATQRERNNIEAIIKTFCPDYTYEELEYDHSLVKFVSETKNPVQFRMALEYVLDQSGLTVRLPANGIRFDQSMYQLNNIKVLPYMGAGSTEYSGYMVIPDGSGSLVRFEDLLKSGIAEELSGSLYGFDYVYHKKPANGNEQIMRLPIFGLVEDTVYKAPVSNSDEIGLEEEEKIKSYRRKTGWVAIIEEGDAMAGITAASGGNQTHKYNSVYTHFNPRPSDEILLSSALAVNGKNAPLTVVSERKYTGSYRIRYIMLTDLAYAELNNVDASGCYDTSYVGMALAYRNELLRSGKLTKQETDQEQIPLYLEMLGVMDVQEKFLSIPITVKKALTTFQDIKDMTKELGDVGIQNLVYKLTGYINGGLINTLPSEIDVEKAAGNEAGLKDLLSFAKDENIEVFLDMDFSYAKTDKLFDGFNKKAHAVRTIDNRYTQKREYSATLQYFTSTGMVAISPSVFSDLFESAKGDLEKLGVTNVSLGAIGSDLNSDFDEDDPYNREDSKQNIVRALTKIREAGYAVMMDSGNAYAIPSASHVLNVSLDGSKFINASEAIPLFGLVYHGYLSYAGKATNTAGDLRYEMLKILENGANPYFILVYRNSDKLKEDATLSKYFSISYENWKEDLIASYKKLNAALAPVMNEAMVNHEFVIGERIPSAEELAADEEQARLEAEESSRLEQEEALESERKENLEEHLNSKKEETAIPEDTESEDLGDETTDTDDSEEESAGTESGSESGFAPLDPEEPENDYPYTKYTSDNGMIVKVTFENGYSFILNYNIFAVTVEETGDTAIPALGYLVLDDQGQVIINSGEEVAA